MSTRRPRADEDAQTDPGAPGEPEVGEERVEVEADGTLEAVPVSEVTETVGPVVLRAESRETVAQQDDTVEGPERLRLNS